MAWRSPSLRDIKSQLQFVIKGKKQKERVLEEYHLAEFGGHVGRDNTFRKVKDRYFWPNCYNDIKSMVSKN